MPWKETEEAQAELAVCRKQAKLTKQLRQDPKLVTKLRDRAKAGDTVAAHKLRLLVTRVRVDR